MTNGTVLETKIPPPVVLFILAIVAWLIHKYVPQAQFNIKAHNIIGPVIVVTGLILNIWPKRLFARANTTVNPMRPDKTTALVTEGAFKYSRNPFYLGHALALLGWGMYLQNWLAIALVIVHVAYITKFQILAEERALKSKFGNTYADYMQRTRRWI